MNCTEGDINQSAERQNWTAALNSETRACLAQDEKYFFRQSLSTPCLNVAKSVHGIEIEDCMGKKYMDFHGNSAHQLGYNNPHILEAVSSQLQTLSFSPRRYTNPKAVELAGKLCGLMQSSYKVLFTPGGTVSVGLALKLARLYTGKHKTVSMWDSFHGAGLDAISVGGEGLFRQGIGPLLPGSEHMMPYNSYRCIFGSCEGCGLKCLDYLEQIIKNEGDIGAVILETIRSTEVFIPPQPYFVRLRKICDQYGVVLILDEIPTALGRTGKMFAFQHYGIEPDILVLGKGLGGALIPMSAVVAKAEMDVGDKIALGHYTHEKNPLGAAAGLSVIEYIEDHAILEHVAQMGAHMHESLLKMQQEFNIIGDVRTIGLLAGVELVLSRDSKERALLQTEKILYRCLKNGLSFKVSQGNILTLSPPLIITKEQLDKAMEILHDAIDGETHERI